MTNIIRHLNAYSYYRRGINLLSLSLVIKLNFYRTDCTLYNTNIRIFYRSKVSSENVNLVASKTFPVITVLLETSIAAQ